MCSRTHKQQDAFQLIALTKWIWGGQSLPQLGRGPGSAARAQRRTCGELAGCRSHPPAPRWNPRCPSCPTLPADNTVTWVSAMMPLAFLFSLRQGRLGIILLFPSETEPALCRFSLLSFLGNQLLWVFSSQEEVWGTPLSVLLHIASSPMAS